MATPLLGGDLLLLNRPSEKKTYKITMTQVTDYVEQTLNIEDISGGLPAGDLVGLEDTAITSPAHGHVLVYNSKAPDGSDLDPAAVFWVNKKNELSLLDDVTVSSGVTDGHVLVYDNTESEFQNKLLSTEVTNIIADANFPVHFLSVLRNC